MPYCVEAGESMVVAIPRIALEQVERARVQLTDPEVDAAERIHETRKRFKETRALLRLARFVLGDDFRFENVWYRDAARSLSTARDAEAIVEGLEKLRGATRDRTERSLLKRMMSDIRSAAEASDVAMEDPLLHLVESLPLRAVSITTWPPIPADFRPIAAGFERTYRDGRDAMRAAMASPLPELFHEWRKRVKDHWYHLQLLRNVSPEIRGRMAAMQQLSRDLGDHHDLVLIEQSIVNGPATSGSEVVLSIARKRREAIERQTIAAGSMMYAERPTSFRRRIESAWRSGASAAP